MVDEEKSVKAKQIKLLEQKLIASLKDSVRDVFAGVLVGDVDKGKDDRKELRKNKQEDTKDVKKKHDPTIESKDTDAEIESIERTGWKDFELITKDLHGGVNCPEEMRNDIETLKKKIYNREIQPKGAPNDPPKKEVEKQKLSIVQEQYKDV